MFAVDQKVHCETYGEGVVVDVSGDVAMGRLTC